MNAVNLIPNGRRTRRTGMSASPQTLGLIGGLALVLIAAILYVTTANTVATRKSELAQVTAGVAGWTSAAGSYASFVQAVQQRTKQLADVRQLAASRFPWSELLSQIGGLLPRDAALSTLQATAPVAAGTPSSATTPPVAGAPSSTGTATASGPAVQLTGCAASQAAVAQSMTQLRRVNGVTDVTLSSSTLAGSAAGASAASTSTGNGGCPFPVQFQVSLTFTPSAPSTAGTPATSGGTSTTAAAPVTTTTAAAQ